MNPEFWHDELDDRPVMVSIICTTYNQGRYIRQALEGFVSQKTNFRFEAIVHDDKSTDDTAQIVREYAERYPSIIKPIFETENQYSKNDGSLSRIIREHARGKYVALCEGDDYWIDPLKLQKQVDFLESNPDFSMCWSDAYVVKEDSTQEQYNRYAKSSETPIEDIIMQGGMWIPTASILIKSTIYRNWPPKGVRFHVGDYPMQVHAADVGRVYYFSEPMACYRYQASGSWSSRTFTSVDKIEKWHNNELAMIDKLIELTTDKCHHHLSQLRHLRMHSLALAKCSPSLALKHYRKIDNKYRPPYTLKTILHLLLGNRLSNYLKNL